MDKKARRPSLSTAILVSVLIAGCGASRNREVAHSFVAQFDRIAEQRKALDKLEEQGKQYDEQLEKGLQESSVTKRVKALGVWVGGFRAMLSQARSIVREEGTLVDKVVSDSVSFSGEPAKYAREATDALRDSINSQEKAIDIGEQMIELIGHYIDNPKSTNLQELERHSRTLEDLDAKEKQSFQRAQDSIARLRATAL